MIDKLIAVLLIMALAAFLVTCPDDYQSPTEMWAVRLPGARPAACQRRS